MQRIFCRNCGHTLHMHQGDNAAMSLLGYPCCERNCRCKQFVWDASRGDGKLEKEK